ncbi:esterase/lipase family protein [Ramlibacter sp. MMS24-I3-19]|uniref:esterase/lipase family protein n=1 Tax=Ramlibacter sp. MMS24-I3-19 TaxID=3416606 RepID=UPI003D071614
MATIGALAILLIHAGPLAVEFLLLGPASRGDPAPRPRMRDLLLAWVREVVQDVRVFAWRQPFAWRRCPDQLNGGEGAVGIVFVHGFVCNRGFWTPWLEEAKRRGHPFLAVNLEPVFGSIDAYAPAIDEAVHRMTIATGRAPLLVCHSMGGLAARAWLRRAADTTRASHVVTIGSPHQGTWLARFSRTANGHQMRMEGEWLRALRNGEQVPAERFTCWYSNCDNVVFPPASPRCRARTTG